MGEGEGEFRRDKNTVVLITRRSIAFESAHARAPRTHTHEGSASGGFRVLQVTPTNHRNLREGARKTWTFSPVRDREG